MNAQSHSPPSAVDRRAVLLTPAGRGAVATIMIDGPDATACVSPFFRAASGKQLETLAINRIAFGRWCANDSTAEEVVVCRRSHRRVEVNCHGGRAAAEAILADLHDAGCREIDWREWAEVNEADRIAAEARRALAAASTTRTAAILLDQYRGALRCAVEAVMQQLAGGDTASAAKQLSDLLALGEIGLHLVQPWRVVLAGRVNVGKSSMINAILGYQRSIVADLPGTTRDVVTAHSAIDGWPVEFSDTAGLRQSDDEVETAGVTRAAAETAGADLPIAVFDASVAWSSDDSELLGLAPRAIVVHNKCDLGRSNGERPDGIWTSAVKGQGIEQLIERIGRRLVPSAPPAGAAVPFTTRQIELLYRALDATGAGDANAAASHSRELIGRKSAQENDA